MYPEARDAVLELHPFNFATARAALSLSDVTPANTWQYQYLLPTGTGTGVPPYCLVVRGTSLDPGGPPWEVGTHQTDGRVLWSNDMAVSIVYTARIADLTSWSALARQVLVKMLAHKLAKTDGLAKSKLQEAIGLLPAAQRRDEQEGTPFVLQPNRMLVLARHRMGGSPYIGIRTYMP